MNKKTIILITIFFLTQGIIHNLGHPVTPAFVRGMGIPDYMFGVFFAAMSFGLMVGGPIWGVLSDQGNRRLYILIGLLLYSIGQYAFAYVGHPVWMVVFRFVSGFGVVSSITLMTSHVVEVSDIKDRAKHLAWLAAAFTLGASLGYGLGGFLATDAFISNLLGTSDLRRLFLIQALTNTAYALVVYGMLRQMGHRVTSDDKVSLIAGLKAITKIEPALLLFLISLTLMTIGSVNLSKYIDVYFDELGYNPQELGLFVMVTGFVSLFASVALVPIFAKRKRQLLTISLIQVASAVIIFYVFRAERFLLAAYTVFMIYVVLKTIYQPLEQSYVSLSAKEGRFGAIMGLRQSFVSIGMVAGPLIGGFLYEIRPLLLFDVSAVSFLLGVGLLGFVHLSRQK